MAQPFRTEVGTFEEVRRALRDIARLLGQTGTAAAIDGDIPSLTEVINAHGGLAQAAVEGKLVTSDRLGRWTALLVGDNGQVVIADSSEDVGMRWGMLGEIPIAMRFKAPIGERGAWSVTDVKTAAYTAVIGEYVRTDTGSAVVNVTLPLVTDANKGLGVAVKNALVATFPTRVHPGGSDTIETVTSFVLVLSSHQVVKFVSDGVSNWLQELGT